MDLRIISLNCHGLNAGVISYIRRLAPRTDIFLLQETWLSDATSCRLGDISNDFIYLYSSAMEDKLSNNVLTGRPFGGTAILMNKRFAHCISPIVTDSARITALCYKNPSAQDLLICSVYLPWNNNCLEQLIEYDLTISVLQSVIDRHVGCSLVAGGDFNVGLTDINNGFNNSLRQFCTSNNIRWLEPIDGSVNFTYHSDVNNHFSLIDHFLCSSHLVAQSKCTNILVDGDNTSDHLAISLLINTLEGLANKPDKQPTVCRLMWDRVDPLIYRSTTSSCLSQINIPTEALLCNSPGCMTHCGELENYYTDLVYCLSHAAEVCVPSVRVGVEKPWWTPELDDLKQECIAATDLWRHVGCPRSGDINAHRILIKLRYKNAIKEAAMSQEADLNESLFEHLCRKDNTSFWKAWRKRFCMNNLKPISQLNGKCGAENILHEFSDHFSKISQPNTTEADSAYKAQVETYLCSKTYLPSTQPIVDVVTVQQCIANLNRHKATGLDGISNEHIMFASVNFSVHICLLFNAMLRHSFVPSDFRFGIIKPLLKCKHGDATKSDMYRGITLAPAISKLFEGVLLAIYGDYLKSDNLQFGFKKQSSCAHALFTFTQAVKYFNSSGSKVHCAFLDASKAFDKILHYGLFVKLIDRGVPDAFLRVLINWYSDLGCCVVWNHAVGQSFPVKCGVRQGGILSPYLFSVYVDDLIDQLRRSGYGIHIGDVFIGAILYADDIVLASCTCNGLQKLINVCCKYSIHWDIVFNTQKSLVSTFGGRCPQSFRIMLNGVPLSWSQRVKYLGCTFICSTGRIDIKQAVGKFYSSLNNILSVLGRNRNEMMAIYLVKSYCLPALVYGCEVWSLTPLDMHSAKVAWNNSYRKVFNACWRESVNPLLYYCNDMPLTYLTDMRKITFYKKLMRTDSSIMLTLFNIARAEINAICAKYNIVLNCNSTAVIKDRIWKSFVDNDSRISF
jgi:exonuclease III